MAAKQKILVVDDDANITELICLYLNKEGFETESAANGKDALDIMQKFQPNLVILDVMMPVMDGYETCREIRKRGSTPVVFLTAKGETFDKVLGLELGADDYIVKPFDNKELVARVKAVLRRTDRDAAQGAGAPVLPGFTSEPGFHQRTAAEPDLGL